MSALNFKEIPSGKAREGGHGEQDTFELFAREVLLHIGFKILSEPNRGPDHGKDLIVLETRRGVGGETTVKWLVSCKHFAHGGKSVTLEDELNIYERVKSHECDGFLGFYSTLPSTGLGTALENFDIETQVYDRERIERTLLGSSEGTIIAKRFFTESIRKWGKSTGGAVDIMVQTAPLVCGYTGENLLVPNPQGIIVFVHPNISDNKPAHYEDIYWSLKGKPDHILKNRYDRKFYTTEWEDIPDVIIPTVYLKWYIALLNQTRGGVTFSEQAFEKLKRFLIAIFPYVSRDLSADQRMRVDNLGKIPYWAGGLG